VAAPAWDAHSSLPKEERSRLGSSDLVVVRSISKAPQRVVSSSTHIVEEDGTARALARVAEI